MNIAPAIRKHFLTGIFIFLLPSAGMTMSLIPPMPPGNELKALLQDIPQLNQKLEENPDLLNGTRLKELDLSGLVVKDATLKNLKWKNIKLVGAVFENVTIEDSQWVGVRCKDCTLRKVTFRRVILDQDRQIKEGGSNFTNGVMDDVRFIDSQLLDVEIDELEPSRLTFERATLKNDISVEAWQATGFIHKSVIHFTIKDSTLYDPRMGSLRYPSEIIIENSRLEKTTLGSRLKRLEIRNSHFEGSGPGYADYVYIADSTVSIGLGEARFIHLKNNAYLSDSANKSSSFSFSVENAQTVLIDGCKKEADFSFGKSNIANLYVNDCIFGDPFFRKARFGYLQLCNVNIIRTPKGTNNWDREYLDKAAWNDVSIRQAQFHNVTFSGPFPVKGLSIGQLQASDSRLPDELTRAARQQGPLDGGCPPLPDLDALKQEALSGEPPPPLSEYLQKLSPAEAPAIRRYAIDHADGTLFFREDWISRYHARNGLGSRPEPPLLHSATLRLKTPGQRLPQYEIALKPGDWQTGISHLDEPCRALPLHAIEPPEVCRMAYHLGIFPESVLTLDLHFAPVPAPARFDVTAPWVLRLHWDENHPKDDTGKISSTAATALLDRKDLLPWVVWSAPAT